MLSEAAQAATRAKRGDPVAPGSVIAVELALDEELGDDEFPAPFTWAHMVAGMYLWAAGERLATTSWCAAARGIPHVLSSAELARAACEASVTMLWLCEDVTDPSERLRRVVGLQAASRAEERSLARSLGLNPEVDRGSGWVLDWAHRRGIKRARVPTRTQMFERVHQTGRGDYGRLSGIAHSTAYAVIGTWLEVVAAQDEENVEPIQAHMWGIALSAMHYTLMACHRRLELSGREDAQMEGLALELGIAFGQVEEAAKTLAWPTGTRG